MKYFVSYAMAGVPKGPVAIDGNLSLEEALSLAGELIAEGSQDVFIGDGNDNQNGEKSSLLAVAAKRNLRWTFAPFSSSTRTLSMVNLIPADSRREAVSPALPFPRVLFILCFVKTHVIRPRDDRFELRRVLVSRGKLVIGRAHGVFTVSLRTVKCARAIS